MRSKLVALAVTGVAIIALAGCKDSQSTDDKATPKQQNAAAAQQQPAEPQPAQEPQPVPAGDGSTLSVVNHPQLGQIVVDSQGFTLYRFDQDSANPPKSNCNGDCAKKWPPSLSPRDWKSVTVTGVDRKLVGQIERADGTCQLTIAGWAVYRYQPDEKPGDIKGQGVGGTWFAITPEGKKSSGGNANATGSGSAPPAPAPQAPAPQAPSGGYGY